MEEWERKKAKSRDEAITVVCMALVVGGIFIWSMTGLWWIFLVAIGLVVYLWNNKD